MKKNIIGDFFAVFFILLIVLLNVVGTVIVNSQYGSLPSVLGLLKTLLMIVTIGGIYTFYLKEKFTGKDIKLKDEINSKIFLIMHFVLFVLTYLYYYGYTFQRFISYYGNFNNLKETVGTQVVNIAIVFQIIVLLIIIAFISYIGYLFFQKKEKNSLKKSIIISFVLFVIYLIYLIFSFAFKLDYIPFSLGVQDVLILLSIIFLLEDSIVGYFMIVFLTILNTVLKLNLALLDVIGGMWITMLFNTISIIASMYILTYAIKIFYRRLRN